MEHQKSKQSVRGRGGRRNAYKPRNGIRDDLWAYELIASSRTQPSPSVSDCSRYYLDPKTLLMTLYPGIYQSWEKFKRNNCGKVDTSDISVKTEIPVNAKFDYSHPKEDGNKNILLLASVADVRHAREAQSHGFGSSRNYSQYDLGESTSYNSNYCPEEINSNIKSFSDVTVKREDDSTYMCI